MAEDLARRGGGGRRGPGRCLRGDPRGGERRADAPPGPGGAGRGPDLAPPPGPAAAGAGPPRPPPPLGRRLPVRGPGRRRPRARRPPRRGRGAGRRVGYRRLVLATGARERFLPFPGWTLPGVVGVGGAQALLKQGARFEGLRVVVAGTGPLLLAVAAALASDGARVVGVAEQAPLRAWPASAGPSGPIRASSSRGSATGRASSASPAAPGAGCGRSRGRGRWRGRC